MIPVTDEAKQEPDKLKENIKALEILKRLKTTFWFEKKTIE
jgi:hypothetical protein